MTTCFTYGVKSRNRGLPSWFLRLARSVTGWNVTLWQSLYLELNMTIILSHNDEGPALSGEKARSK
jgi:hypothetical protein